MSRTYRRSWRVDWAWYWRRWGDDSARLASQKYLERDGCGKGPGYELWSRRPGSGHGNSFKPTARRIERRRHRRELEQILDREYLPENLCRDCAEDAAGECDPCWVRRMAKMYGEDHDYYADYLENIGSPDLSDLEDEDYDDDVFDVYNWCPDCGGDVDDGGCTCFDAEDDYGYDYDIDAEFDD